MATSDATDAPPSLHIRPTLFAVLTATAAGLSTTTVALVTHRRHFVRVCDIVVRSQKRLASIVYIAITTMGAWLAPYLIALRAFREHGSVAVCPFATHRTWTQ